MSIKIFFSKIHARIKHAMKILKTYAGLDDLIAIIILLIGVSYYFLPVPTQFLEDTHAEFIGMGLTVLVIANATEYQQTKAEKNKLILQLGSPDRGFAIEAARQLRQRGWIRDGSLFKANLSGADLTEANLTGAILSRADLTGAILSRAALTGADLTEAILKGADLTGAELELLVADPRTIWKGVVKHDQEDRRPMLLIFKGEDGTEHTVDSWNELLALYPNDDDVQKVV